MSVGSDLGPPWADGLVPSLACAEILESEVGEAADSQGLHADGIERERAPLPNVSTAIACIHAGGRGIISTIQPQHSALRPLTQALSVFHRIP